MILFNEQGNILNKIATKTDSKLNRQWARIVSGNAENLSIHLAMVDQFLQPNDRLTLMVQLESSSADHFRYLVMLTSTKKPESAILGIDISVNQLTIGMILPIWTDLIISLDGDGGFKLTSVDRCYIIKPVSIHALWTAYQSLHKSQACHFNNGLTHRWLEYYRNVKYRSNQICINEWNQMDEIISHHPHFTHPLSSDEETLRMRIHIQLKEIMFQVNLDEVTSKFLREELEKRLSMSLISWKEYIDDKILEILAQMDKPTLILPYLYLGSEWNASNFDELKSNQISYILNISREIENFFPEHFTYLNIRVHDHHESDLLKEWERTFRFIHQAKTNNQRCLVHCKMGISRSASTVLAYLMKEYNYSLINAWKYVQTRRTSINPNEGFRNQLLIYEGILSARRIFSTKLNDSIVLDNPDWDNSSNQ